MKKYLLTTLFGLTMTSAIATTLMPGARVYHIKTRYNAQAHEIQGTLFNGQPSNVLTATNPIIVPNTLPTKIADKADYTVQPKISKDGYEIWTKSVKYVDADGNGCYIQFGWSTFDKTGEVAVLPVNTHSRCITPDWTDGTNVLINPTSNQ